MDSIGSNRIMRLRRVYGSFWKEDRDSRWPRLLPCRGRSRDPRRVLQLYPSSETGGSQRRGRRQKRGRIMIQLPLYTPGADPNNVVAGLSICTAKRGQIVSFTLY